MYVLLEDAISITGQVRIETRDAQGNLVYDSGWKSNRCNVNLAVAVAAWLCGINNTGYNPVLSPTQTELGTGTGTPGPNDTDLFAPVEATLVHCTAIAPEPGSTGVAQFITQYFGTANNQGTYSELGLKDTNGKLFAHIVENVTITSGLTTTVTWNLTCSV